MILNIQAMLDASDPCTEEYFTEFDPRKYQVNIQLPPHQLIFVELTPSSGYPADKVLGNGGLKVGQYVYSFRYVTKDGDRTAWTPTTPSIPVPVTINTNSTQYPSIKTYGAEPATQGPYGIVLQVRIDNELDFDFIEIKRYSYNTGAPVGFTPSAEIIGTLDLIDGELSIKTIVDLGAIGTPITDEDDTTNPVGIEACKTLRYFENRLFLMNVKYQSMDIQATFVNNGRPNMFPVLENIGKIGYDSAWYGAYRRSLFRGEKYGWAVGFWNNMMGRTFATPVTNFTNYQMPERRDEASVETQNFSYTPLPIASTIQLNAPGKCHETYNLVNAVAKTDCCSFKNIACDGDKGDGGVTCDGSEGINNMPAFCGCGSVSNPTLAADIGYQPLTPIGERDPNVSGHNYVVNTRVENDCANYGDYQPFGFGPEYYALGNALNGIDASVLPESIIGFSVLRTKPAGRIVFQGIGFYYLYHPDNDRDWPAKKAADKFWFYSFEASPRSGLVSQQVINEIGLNPGGRYQAQLVSPVGLFSEVPHGENRTLGNNDHIDMCAYPRYYEDQGTINLPPNPTAGGTGGYIQFGKWRNPVFPGWVANLAVNRAAFTINEFRTANNAGTEQSGVGSEFIGDRGANYFVLGVDTTIYGATSVGLNACDEKYPSNDMQAFHEPMYNVNIVDTFANVPASDVNTYYDTGTYVKLRSKVGVYEASGSVVFPLCGERWEDCTPYAPNTYTNFATIDTNAINSLIRIVLPNGNTEYWLNANGVANADIDAMIPNLPYVIGTNTPGGSKDGVTISGFFRTTLDTTAPFPNKYTIVFTAGTTPMVPANGSRIWVDYDNEVPVQAYGGDVYIGDDVACFIDRQIPNGGGNPANTGTSSPLPLNMGLPYYGWQINPRMFITNDAEGGNKIQDCSKIDAQWLRQLIAIFNCESRVHIPYMHEAPAVDPPAFQIEKFFPATNYIMRPNDWEPNVKDDNFCGGTGIVYDDYNASYPDEWIYWRYGGYRFLPLYNIDYLHINNTLIWNSKPLVGFREQLEFCTRIAYSLDRDISRVDAPGIRTFLPQNKYDIEDLTGEIKFGWSALGGNKGNNLYALTDRGVCLVLTDKNVLSDATAEQVAVMKTSGGNVIGGEYWISREIGMNEEFYRSRAEYNNFLFFANRTSVYLFEDNQIVDIARDFNYFPRVYQVIQGINGGYGTPMTGVYDVLHGEYMFQVVNIEREEAGTFVFSRKNKAWNGAYSYAFDNYLSFDNRLLGMGRISDGFEAVTYELNSGDLINGSPIEAWVLGVTAQQQILAKEFQGIRVVSNVKPDYLNFYDNLGQYKSGLVQTSINPVSLRDYGGAFEQYIGRKTVVGNDNRMQNTAMLFEIGFNTQGYKKVVDVGIYWKPLV